MKQAERDRWAAAAADAFAASLMKDRPAVRDALSRLDPFERKRLADCSAWLSHEALRTIGAATGRKY